MITSILRQSYPFQRLYLNVPKTYEIPRPIKTIDDERFAVNVCERDYGPITKLLPTLDIETDPETVIVICDDDRKWKRHTLSHFIKSHVEHPTDALSLSGFCIGSFPIYFQRCSNSDVDYLVDWIEGTSGILLKRSMIRDSKLLTDFTGFSQDTQRLLFKNDDHWISYVLEKNNINRRKIKGYSEDFFTDTYIRKIDAISGNFLFYIKVAKLSTTLGIYHRTLPINMESGQYSIPVIVIILLICWIMYRMTKRIIKV